MKAQIYERGPLVESCQQHKNWTLILAVCTRNTIQILVSTMLYPWPAGVWRMVQSTGLFETSGGGPGERKVS